MMPRYHLQKKEREINNQKEILSIIKTGKYLTIALCRNNEPYIVTLSCGYDERKNAFYFHSRLRGLKCEFIKDNPHVCATIIEDKGYIMNDCAHEFRSVIIRGKMSFVETLEEKKYGMDILLEHLEENPDKIKQESLSNDIIYRNLGILRLDVIEMHGKWGR
ncbi:MAG: pyridoxamine 5'-phosphate oxidase family protein [Planctomycetia bacterium]|nr:pyridoxamine 5'-phosphate oxidase family protein [Planctomycetia bacterium]